MKLKEIPVSLIETCKLSLLSAEKIKSKQGNEFPVVVSLTTIPYRLSKVHLVIRSVLSQSVRPRHIVLWINEDMQSQIPQSLKKLEGDIFQIRLTKLHCSHKKLIHSLELFENLPVVTCDDDVIYDNNWLKSLVETHQKYPDCVVAHRVRCIKYDDEGMLLPYKQWVCGDTKDEKFYLPIGSEGILYPAGQFSDLIRNDKLFLELAPKADDLWFKAVALVEGVGCKKVESPVKDTIPIMGTQKVSLKKENVSEDKNTSQWQALEKHFNLK